MIIIMMVIICLILKLCSNTPLLLLSFLLMVAFNFNAILQLLTKKLAACLGALLSLIFVKDEVILCLLMWLTILVDVVLVNAVALWLVMSSIALR